MVYTSSMETVPIEFDTRIADKFAGGYVTIYKDGRWQKIGPFDHGYERGTEPIWLTIHGTAGGGTLEWILSAEPGSKRFQKYAAGVGLFHYLIDRDGSITNIIDPDKWVFHSSINYLDRQTIGVELLNPDFRNREPYTEEQYVSLITLYRYLRNKYPLTVMLSHNRSMQKIIYEARGKKPPQVAKACPGPGFNWPKFRQMMVDFGYTFQYDVSKESIWNIR